MTDLSVRCRHVTVHVQLDRRQVREITHLLFLWHTPVTSELPLHHAT